MLYDENPFMYFTIDADGIVVSVNPYGAEQWDIRSQNSWDNRSFWYFIRMTAMR